MKHVAQLLTQKSILSHSCSKVVVRVNITGVCYLRLIVLTRISVLRRACSITVIRLFSNYKKFNTDNYLKCMSCILE